MTTRSPCLHLAWLLFALSASPATAATAFLNPPAIFAGDIAELVIEYDSKMASLYALDSGPLAADFEILDIKSRVFRLDQQAAGRHRMQWRLQLLPRRSGSLVVPEIRFGDQSTAPLTLEVKPVPDDVRSSQQVFVELDSKPRSPYVGQQTLLSLRLFHNTPLRIDGLAEPRLPNAASYRDLDERVYFVSRDGKEFRVLEKQMLIFPGQAGELELPPAVLRGQLRQSAPAGDGDIPASRKVSRKSNPLRLQVRQPPAAFSGRYWLPARELVISQRLQPLARELRIGDSIDWTLTLEARGLPAASLPANLFEYETPNYTVYADQPRRSERLADGELIARLEQRFAIIVTAAGSIDLPGFELAWWDLEADRERLARLEATHLGYAAAAAPGSGRGTDADAAGLLFTLGGDGIRWFWPVASLAGSLLLLLALRALWRRLEHRIGLLLRRRRIRGLLKQACRENRARRARALLIEWGRARWPGEAINGLYQISDRCRSARLAEEVSKLDAALFSRGNPGWRGSGLWTALASGRRDAGGSQPASRLYGLYPD